MIRALFLACMLRASAAVVLPWGPVVNLPGAPANSPPMESGYLSANGRALFGWYVQGPDVSAPLVVWQNGGPGCSSVQGMLSEQGPHRVASSGDLETNPWGWQNVAHMLFLESPAGVGFSYSNDTSDYVVGDDRAAADVSAALVTFISQHRELQDNKLYLSGEVRRVARGVGAHLEDAQHS